MRGMSGLFHLSRTVLGSNEIETLVVMAPQDWSTFRQATAERLAALEVERAAEQLHEPSQLLPGEEVLLFGSAQKLPFAHLSNFTATSFRYGEHAWDTSEHAYQAMLCLAESHHHKLAAGSTLSNIETGVMAVFDKDVARKVVFWGEKRLKTGRKRSMVGVVAKMAIKEKTGKKLGLSLRTEPNYSTQHVATLFLDILKAKYEADADLQDILVSHTGNKYLLEFDRGAERQGKLATQRKDSRYISRWAGMIKNGRLWGINLQGELQMAMREWFRNLERP